LSACIVFTKLIPHFFRKICLNHSTHSKPLCKYHFMFVLLWMNILTHLFSRKDRWVWSYHWGLIRIHIHIRNIICTFSLIIKQRKQVTIDEETCLLDILGTLLSTLGHCWVLCSHTFHHRYCWSRRVFSNAWPIHENWTRVPLCKFSFLTSARPTMI
jgi:hypothetical protein